MNTTAVLIRSVCLFIVLYVAILILSVICHWLLLLKLETGNWSERSGLRLRFQPVGLTGRRVDPTARREIPSVTKGKRGHSKTVIPRGGTFAPLQQATSNPKPETRNPPLNHSTTQPIPCFNIFRHFYPQLYPGPFVTDL